jgi:hypothetical protein
MLRRRRRHRLLAAAVLLALCVARVAAAHAPEPKADRELVRLQGYREVRPEGVAIAAQIVLSILGKDHRFHLTARQTFQLGEQQDEPALRDRLVLQGERQALARIAAARPNQRVTILADHRPGRSDLFVLTVDLCPSE